MGILASSYKGAAGATAASKGMSPERFAERSAAYAQKEQSDQELSVLQGTRPTKDDIRMKSEAQTIALQNALEQQKQIMYENNRRTSIDAMERFDVDGDYEKLNTMFSDLSKSGSKMFGKIARIDKLTFNDIPMLKKQGFDDKQIDNMLNNKYTQKSYGRITQTDGTTSFGDIDALKHMVGYNVYANEKELSRQQGARLIEQINALGLATGEPAPEAFRRTSAENPDLAPDSPEFAEAYAANYDMLERNKHSRNSDGTEVNVSTGKPVRLTELQDMVHTRLALEGIGPGHPDYFRRKDEITSEVLREKGMSGPEKKESNTREAEESLKTKGFWKMDFANISDEDRMEIEPDIRVIENQGGADLDRKTKDQLLNISELMHLGAAAGELTDEQTGLFDNVLYSVKKYMFDEVDNIRATAAYATLRNVMRHDLFGSVLPTTEVSNFIEQFGSLGQQRGPILDQVVANLETIKNGYETMLQLDHPMVLRYRTGRTARDINDTIRRINDRIKMIGTIKGDPEIKTDGTVGPGASVTAPIIKKSDTPVVIPKENWEIMYKSHPSNKGGATQ